MGTVMDGYGHGHGKSIIAREFLEAEAEAEVLQARSLATEREVF
jgi:hypothetical protein